MTYYVRAVTVVFVETSHFTQLVSKYLDEEEYRELQKYLMAYPDNGDIIRGTGGVRKLRWSRQGMGKLGGVRVIYYWAKAREQIYMLTMYSKSDQEDIEVTTLKRIAKQLEELE